MLIARYPSMISLWHRPYDLTSHNKPYTLSKVKEIQVWLFFLIHIFGWHHGVLSKTIIDITTFA